MLPPIGTRKEQLFRPKGETYKFVTKLIWIAAMIFFFQPWLCLYNSSRKLPRICVWRRKVHLCLFAAVVAQALEMPPSASSTFSWRPSQRQPIPAGKGAPSPNLSTIVCCYGSKSDFLLLCRAYEFGETPLFVKPVLSLKLWTNPHGGTVANFIRSHQVYLEKTL